MSLKIKPSAWEIRKILLEILTYIPNATPADFSRVVPVNFIDGATYYDGSNSNYHAEPGWYYGTPNPPFDNDFYNPVDDETAQTLNESRRIAILINEIHHEIYGGESPEESSYVGEGGLVTLIEDVFDYYQQEAVANDFDFLLETLDNLESNLLDALLNFSEKFGGIVGNIEDALSDFFEAATDWNAPAPRRRRRRDPLALDLDGDGVESTALGAWGGVFFDHDNDGVKEGTGWVNADDGLLVLDRNANGTIDSGRELFGDNTQLEAGGFAANGLEALADLDSNHDGQIDINDSAYADLRVWQDSNQDGISQSQELKTLEELNIASISTTDNGSGSTQNGNLVTHTSTFTYDDGSVGQSADFGLAASAFYTKFKEPIVLTGTDAERANVHGAGRVRNFRNAAARSPALATKLDNYSAATTREEQQAQLGGLLAAWAETSDMPSMMQRAADNGYIINFTFGDLGRNTSDVSEYFRSLSNAADASTSLVRYDDVGAPTVDGIPYVPGLRDPAQVTEGFHRNQSGAYQDWIRKLSILERFNGREFIDFDSLTKTAQNNNIRPTLRSLTDSLLPSGFGLINVTIRQERLDLLQQAYDSLEQSVYDSLIFQTRFDKYIDDISLQIVDGSLELDFSAMEAHLKEDVALNNDVGVSELFEFIDAVDEKLTTWDYKAVFSPEYFQTLNLSETQRSEQLQIEVLGQDIRELQITNASDNIILGNHFDNALTVMAGNSSLDGGAGNDSLTAHANANNSLKGGAGNDVLGLTEATYRYRIRRRRYGTRYHSAEHSNTFEGGTGDDVINGLRGADTYKYNLGDGHDTITDLGGADKLVFGVGVEADDLWFERATNDLEITLFNSGDSITVKDWYSSNSNKIETIKLNSGEALMNNQLDQLVQAMATFGVPAAGTTELSGQIENEIAPVIAASWG